MSVEQAYNNWAGQYDHDPNKTRDLDARATRETLKRYAFDTVLELGCGTGKNTRFLLEKAERVTGLDFSEEMLNQARIKITDSRVQFIKADLTQAWEVADGLVDLVTASLVLEHIENLDHIFEQTYGKLTRSGYFFISELHPFKQYSGSKARFDSPGGIQEPEAYVHHLSDYLNASEKNGFGLLELKEWFDEETENKLPRLISFVFQKQ